MARSVTVATWVVLLCSPAAFPAGAAMKTQSWGNNAAGFAQFHERIAKYRGRNLLRRKRVKVMDRAQMGYGRLKMLWDGSAGVRLGEGRVGINGNPAVLTFYLGEVKPITHVGLFTYNSDARANQDFEVRFANNAAHPGEKPKFPDAPDLTTGDTVLGKNRGGFLTYFRARDGKTLAEADWVQFRIWRTYNVKAGSPAKDKNTAKSWCSVIELEVWGEPADSLWIPDDDIERGQTLMQQALAKAYQKRATWQATLLAAREALANAAPAASDTPGFKPFVSPVMTGAKNPLRVKVNVAGLKRLWLEADTGGDSYDSDQAIWGDPVLIDKDGRATPLTDLKPAFVQVGWGKLMVDQTPWKKPLQVKARTFKRGLWAHAPSRLCYMLDGKYERFEAWVGIGPTTAGSSRFKVLEYPSASLDVDALWRRLARDFRDERSRQEMVWEKEDKIWDGDWPKGDRAVLAARYAKASHRTDALAKRAAEIAKSVTDDAGLARVREVYHRSRRAAEALAKIDAIPWRAIRMGIQDLTETFGKQYPNGPAFLMRLDALEQARDEAIKLAAAGTAKDIDRAEQLVADATALQREALLANPLLDFDKLLLIKRRGNIGLPANWQSNSSLAKTGYDNEIATLSMKNPSAGLQTVYRPDGKKFVGDVDLHFNADKMLFSSIGGNGRWHIFEIRADGSGLRQVTRNDQPDVDYYDACYLPDGDIIFCSTANFVGVPCVYGSSHVAMLYRMKPDGTGIRQLCFEQDHDWCPTVLPNGRVLYLRWEYTDTPHSNTRILFHMNPDGTDQKEYYGSNSYWPNSFFYARPIPGDPTKVVGIASGHHGDRRMGELVILDPAKGRREATGAVQRIPGYGKKVEAVIKDRLTAGIYPKFLHPYPLSEKHFLVACKPTAKSSWGIYLVDTFDNMVLLREEPGYALLEPVPLRRTKRPPVLPDRVRGRVANAAIPLSRGGSEGGVALAKAVGPSRTDPPVVPPGRGDVMRKAQSPPSRGGSEWGVALAKAVGLLPADPPVVPPGRGDVMRKAQSPPSRGGSEGGVGPAKAVGLLPADPPVVPPGRRDAGPRRALRPATPQATCYVADVYAGPGLAGIPRGTVKALRVFTYHFAYQGMGGLLGVVGIDGPWDIKRIIGTVPVEADGSAMFRIPANTPISVQPLDAEGKALQLMRSWMTAMPGEVLSCAGCHESQNESIRLPRTIAASKAPRKIRPWYGRTRGFSYAREVQPVIDKYCVACHDGEKSIDLRGTQRIRDWRLTCPGNGGNRGGKFSVGYANLARYVRRPGIESDYHLLTPMEFHADTTELVQLLKAGHKGVQLDKEAWDRLITWIDLNAPFHSTWKECTKDPGVQRQRRRELRKLYAFVDEDPEADIDIKPVDLGPPVAPAPMETRQSKIENIPNWPFDAAEAKRRQAAAGKKITRTIDLGNGARLALVLAPAGEYLMAGKRVRVDKAFWVGTCEVSNEQYAAFDPAHDSTVESKDHYQFGIHGYPLNDPKQPVVRVAQLQAAAFCEWLSKRTGLAFSLPTEEQWEYAARAGAATPFFFGPADADFSKFANMADAKLREFASNPYKVYAPLPRATKYDDYIPKDTRFNDGGIVTMPIGSYKPNAWGLHDVHGNVWEWTRTLRSGRAVACGGSWRDRPYRCTVSFRITYPPYQRVHDVGFRVVCAVGPASKKVAAAE